MNTLKAINKNGTPIRRKFDPKEGPARTRIAMLTAGYILTGLRQRIYRTGLGKMPTVPYKTS